MAGHLRTAVCRLCLALTAQTSISFLPELGLHYIFLLNPTIVFWRFLTIYVNSASSSFCFISEDLFHGLCKYSNLKKNNCVQN